LAAGGTPAVGSQGIGIAGGRAALYQPAAMTRTRANLLLLIAAAVWGFAFYFHKIAVDHVGPVQFVAGRTLLAGLCIVPVALWELRGKTIAPGLWLISIGSGVVFFIAAVIHQAGFETATVTNSGFLTALYVIATPILAWVFLRRLPPVYVWPALVLALVGTWFLGGGTFDGLTWGDRLIALSAFFWGAQMLITGVAGERYGLPFTYTAIQFLVVSVLAIPAAIATETITVDGLVGALPAFLYVGVMSGAVTYSLFAIGLRYTTPSEGVIIISTEALFAALAGMLLLGERMSPLGGLGAALMFTATLVVQAGPTLKRFLTRPA
jgi:drug/metabolite transporter (DMT)-like permease